MAEKRKKGEVANAPVASRKQVTDRKVAKVLNIPFRKLNAGDELDVEVVGPVRLQMMEGGGKNDKKEAATVARVTLLDTGAMEDLICPTVLNSTLTRAYGPGVKPTDGVPTGEPGEDTGAWHGKLLRLVCSKREGKRYMDVNCFELEA